MSDAPAWRVRAVLLPAGEDRTVWIRNGRLTFEPLPGAETVADGGFAVPGLVDAHCHVGLGPEGPVPDRAGQLAQAYAVRDAGTLLIRDAGSPVDTRPLAGYPDTPRIIHAGRHLARTRRYLPGVGIELASADLPAAAEEQARRSDGWIKLVGDWIDRERGDLAPEWPAAAIRDAIARAHAVGARVTAHVFGEEALPDLLAAGIDCIEHGTGLTEDLVATMAERKVALVPTLINVANFPAFADAATRFPAYAARMRRLHGSGRARIRAAYEAGVPIYAGSDAGGGIPHGRIVDEVRALHEMGMPAEEALAAGSWAARAWLGLPGLEEGAPADVVVYDADPRKDLTTLASPRRLVVRGRPIR